MKILRLCLISIGIIVIAASAAAIEIPLENQGGVYTIPVRINGIITLNFIVDSGAAEVAIPDSVIPTLLRAGTIEKKDFLPGKAFKLADGTVVQSSRFRIRELSISGYRATNVPAAIVSASGFPLLGQSFLKRLHFWALDNRTHTLRIAEGVEVGASEGGYQIEAEVKPAGKTAETTVQSDGSSRLIPPRVRLQNPSRGGGSGSLISPSVDHQNLR